jgi:DNA-binding response OmpR family regulator
MNEKGCILIVDDDPHIRQTVKTILSAEGFDVSMAESGEECLNLLKEGFSGVILLDIMMPVMDGWDTIKAIISEDLFNGVVIAMLTARSAPDEKMVGLQEYVIDYITKPFDIDDLIRKTEYFLRFVP